MKLCDKSCEKSQNLQLIRFIASICVIIAHAFAISTGNEENELLTKITGGYLGLGALAVCVFFVAGGFLIARSVEKQGTAIKFFKARAIRIFPPLIFTTVCVMFLGVIFSTYTPLEYFTNLNTWKYLLNSIFISVHNLPGVFEDNPYLPTVNGALWTLPVEFVCYIVCFIMYKCKFLKKKRFLITIPVVLIGSLGLEWVGSYIPFVHSLIRPCLLFYIGMGFWTFREYINLKKSWLLISSIGFLAAINLGVPQVGIYIFFPYIIFMISFGLKHCSSKLGNLGNYSYGIYLWGFPVQQAVVSMNGGIMNPYLNMLVSIPITIVFGVITYFWVEKKKG